MPKSRLSAFLSLLLVFLSGALVGVFAYRLYTVNTVMSTDPPKRDPEEVRRRVVQEMHTRVKLDDQQTSQLNKIYDRTREQFDQLHKKANSEGHAVWDKQVEEIKAILRPDQVPLYDQLRAEKDAERKRRHHDKK